MATSSHSSHSSASSANDNITESSQQLRSEFNDYFRSLKTGQMSSEVRRTVQEFFDKALGLAADASDRNIALRTELKILREVRDTIADNVKDICTTLADDICPHISASANSTINEMFEIVKDLPNNHLPTQTTSFPSAITRDVTVPSFSSVVKNKTPKRNQKRSHDFPVLIKPKQHTDSSVTKSDITKMVDPTALNVGISRFRKAKDGQMIVAVESEAELLALRSELSNNRQFASHYELRTPAKRLPRMALISVPATYTDDEVAHALYSKNIFISKAYHSLNVFRNDIKFIFHADTKGRQPQHCR